MSNFLIFFLEKNVSAEKGPSTLILFFFYFFILCLIIYEIFEYNKVKLRPNIGFVISITIIILLFGQFSDEKSFIYFQF